MSQFVSTAVDISAAPASGPAAVYASRWRPPDLRYGSSSVHPRRGHAHVWRAPRRRQSIDIVVSRSHSAAATITPAPVEAERCQRLVLGLGADAYRGIPLWNGAQRWARITVPVAYDLWYDQIRDQMPNNPVSRRVVVAVADARARYAEGTSGRHCRPTNATLAALAGVSEGSVSRATKALRLLDCATEIFRGRQRTKAERLASWALDDRARGWASVYALHQPRPAVDNSRDHNGRWCGVSPSLSTHPRRGFHSHEKLSFSSKTPTGVYPQPPPTEHLAGQGPTHNDGATRPASTRGPRQRSRPSTVDEGGRLLAAQWRADGRTPAWAARHTDRGWAAALAAPAAHGWTPADLNMAIGEWVRVGGNWLPTDPYKPIGLMRRILSWHGDMAAPPAAADRAREAAAAAERKRERDSLPARKAHAEQAAASPEHRAAAKLFFAQRRRRG